jgi:hypothetical protein
MIDDTTANHVGGGVAGMTLVAAFGIVLVTALPPASPLALPGMSNMISVSAGVLVHSRPPRRDLDRHQVRTTGCRDGTRVLVKPIRTTSHPAGEVLGLG